MTDNRLSLPAPVGKIFSLLPAYPGSVLFVSALNLALVQHLPGDVQTLLTGKKIRIKVIDAGVAFDFAWQNGQFAASRANTLPDLTIGATAHDFLLLAQRKEDPDTLFFSRRLLMEGDTELGLLVKNTLDAMDLPVFDRSSLPPPHVFANKVFTGIRQAMGNALK